MKITRFEASNIKRLRAVEITPNGPVVEITGKNKQGKTSILDAIWWALGGKKPVQSKPVRAGADRGVIQLDLGEYTVTKTFKVKDDGSYSDTLVVKNKDGFKASSPQDVLNGFLGTLTFDPLAFADMKPREQVVALRALVPDYDFDAANEANKDDFNRRTDVNRDVASLANRIEAIDIPEGTPDERVDLNELMAQLNNVLDANAAAERAHQTKAGIYAQISRIKSSVAEREARIASLKDEIARLEGANMAALNEIATMQRDADAIAVGDRVDPTFIREQIATAEGVNRAVEQRDERARLVEQRKTLVKESERLTAAIEDRKAGAAKAVRAAKLPVEGLELTEDEVLLNGLPFDQASDAEQLRVSIVVAAAMNPKLRIVRIRDAGRLDSEAWEALCQFATDNDLQIWAETVESHRETAIVIEDGMVASKLEAAE